MDTLTGDWGTLGEPHGSRGAARLRHVVETDLAILRHGFYEAGAAVPLHRHELPSLLYGVGGPCISVAENRIVTRRLTFHPAGYEHSLRFRGDSHVLAIEIIGQDGLAWPSASLALPATLYDYVWRAMLPVADGADRAQVNLALAELLRRAQAFASQRIPPWLLDLVDCVHADWRAVPSTAALAQRFMISPQHLCRAFRRFTGVTLQQYGVMIRLDHARGMLWGTGKPISQVATETGFADQSHLTRALAEHSGKTPLRLRWSSPCVGGKFPPQSEFHERIPH